MKILILGGTGVLGHELVKQFSKKYEVFTTIRRKRILAISSIFKNIIDEDRFFFIDNIDQSDEINDTIKKLSPEILINCVGSIKQKIDKDNVNDIKSMFRVNTNFPHTLSEICSQNNIKLIHFSTDCVFSGKKGNYKESDLADPTDDYGKSKMLGEITNGNHLTIRTSFIGPELYSKSSFFEWVISNKNNEINGFDKAIYSGFTTQAFAPILSEVIDEHKNLNGLLHISSNPISKFDLIKLIDKVFKLNIKINRNSSFQCDRSLNSLKFRNKTKITIPSWNDMIKNLYESEN